MRGVIGVAAVALLASGCATYTWSRPDTPAALAAQDEAECAQLARDAATDISLMAFPRFYAGLARPWPYAGWWADPYWWGPADPLWRVDVEQRIHDRCMRSRGYELHRVPDD
jgi:hypothetical protein